MGSGETSPTMVTLHRELAAHLEGDRDAVILETPYGFQVNRDDISTRAREYFRKSVGLTTMVAPDADATAGDLPGGADRIRDLVRRAGWVFSGPGSPSYALRRWHTQRLGEILCERVARGHGVTVMASAAACTVGFAALPVYEIYKAGHPPVWLDGLDLLGALGLPVAVIPHYNNTEGGTHDTRFCYLGETRLRALERELPGDAAVLGLDEHTAVVIDLDASPARVWGRGVMTIRRKGDSLLMPGGDRRIPPPPSRKPLRRRKHVSTQGVCVEVLLLRCDPNGGLAYRRLVAALGRGVSPYRRARRLALLGGGDALHLVHSTSWRATADGHIVLTYLIHPDPDPDRPGVPLPEPLTIARSPVPGDPTPPRLELGHVVAHAVRHLAFLERTDPAVAGHLATWPDIQRILAAVPGVTAGELHCA
jgi:hypothetical protein